MTARSTTKGESIERHADLLIRGGEVIDGSGAARVRADVRARAGGPHRRRALWH